MLASRRSRTFRPLSTGSTGREHSRLTYVTRKLAGPCTVPSAAWRPELGSSIGPTTPGQRHDLEPSPMSEGLGRKERNEFRLMRRALDGCFKDEDWWVSRRAMLRAIKNPGSTNVTRHVGLTGEVEWYTPRQYLDAALQVMGAIELDPASSDRAQAHVQAEDYFTLETDGLEQSWFGRVFLNPPYRMPDIKRFVFKMVDAFEGKEIDEGILLTNSATDTELVPPCDECRECAVLHARSNQIPGGRRARTHRAVDADARPSVSSTSGRTGAASSPCFDDTARLHELGRRPQLAEIPALQRPSAALDQALPGAPKSG